MLTISHLTCRIAGRTLIDDASAAIMDGWRVGVVGLNGTGKSTLFRMIAGELAPDGGDITLATRLRLGVVQQDMPASEDPLLDIVLAADKERLHLLAESETTTDPERVAEIYARLQTIEAYTAPARAATILAGLGFTDEQMAAPFSALSGGWRMRVALAAALFQQPDLLLLDEPTNHLDLEATLWLEGYLANYPDTLLIISHDRDLLNACTSHTLHLHTQTLTLYAGSYDTFERTRAERLTLQQKLHEKQQTQRAHIQAFIDRFRAKATKARQAQSRLKMLEKMDLVDAVTAERAIRFRFPQPAQAPPPLMMLENISVGYTPGKPVLRRVSARLDQDDRIALLGANGNGKSTLVKLIAGKLAPLSGTRLAAPGLRIGYFSQHQTEELDPAATPYESLLRLCLQHNADARETVVRARLGQFGFSKELADNRISTLSGGEKARLLFALMSFAAPHLLLLDEPTNHLDMDARSALVDALNAYEGAVVIVSHDPTLLERVADRLWLVHDGGVQDFDGDMADYRRFVLDQRRAARRGEKPKRTDEKVIQRKSSADQRRQLAPLLQRVRQAEQEVTRLTEEKARLEASMANPAFYADPSRAGEAQRIHGLLSTRLAEAEQRWLDASEACEQLQAGMS